MISIHKFEVAVGEHVVYGRPLLAGSFHSPRRAAAGR